MSDCKAELLTSNDPDRSRWWCPECGPNINGPCLPYPNEPQGKTHFPGCYRQPMHHNCAVKEVDCLRRQLDTAREALQEAESKLTVWARVPNHQMGISHIRVRKSMLKSLRDKTRRTLAVLDGEDKADG